MVGSCEIELPPLAGSSPHSLPLTLSEPSRMAAPIAHGIRTVGVLGAGQMGLYHLRLG